MAAGSSPAARSLDTSTRFPLDLLIFSPSSPTIPAWAKCRAKRNAGQRIGVAGTHLVVREDQVRAAALDGERCRQVFLRDDRALNVPAGPALPQFAAGPAGFPVAGDPPKQRVQRLALAAAAGVAAAFGEEFKHFGFGKPGHRAQGPGPGVGDCLPAASTS